MFRRAKSRIVRPTPARLVTAMPRAMVAMAVQPRAVLTTAIQAGAMTSVAFAEAVKAVVAGLALSSTTDSDPFQVFDLAKFFSNRGLALVSSPWSMLDVELCCGAYATRMDAG